MSYSVWPHEWQPTRLSRPWDSPGKNTGVGCHFLLQCMKMKSESEVAQSCLTPSNPMDCSLPGSSVHGISEVRILKWAAISFSRGSSWFRDWTHVSCIGRHILYHWANREAPKLSLSIMNLALSILFIYYPYIDWLELYARLLPWFLGYIKKII